MSESNMEIQPLQNGSEVHAAQTAERKRLGILGPVEMEYPGKQVRSHGDSVPYISIVVPCRNEALHIGGCLESVLANDYPKEKLEVIIVDGMSDDDTREVIESYRDRFAFIQLLDNPERIVPTALNRGIRAAKGEIIIRMDAHNVYPTNYISGLAMWLVNSGADNVGGTWITVPAGNSAALKAIALGLSHPLGVGNAYYRTGTTEPRWVDTVPFGCYRREVFERIGMFDEELVRNQDDEFNHRLIKNGGRILLVPGISSHYKARDSLGKVWRMFYQYGYYKPLAAHKAGGILTLRQVIPSIFVLSLFITGLLAFVYPASLFLFTGISLLYGATVLGVSTVSAFSEGPLCIMSLCCVFPALHFSYGIGFLKGVLDFILLRRRRINDPARIPMSR